MRVCLGGTFHPFHTGHETLLREAVRDADAVFIGITRGDLASRPDRSIPDWEMRADLVRGFVEDQIGYMGSLEINPIDDGVGPAATGDYDAIAVSAETLTGAHRINEMRAKKKLKRLAIRMVPHRLADDLLPISSTRVAAEDIDLDGNRITPVRIAVGSANPVKVAAVKQEFDRLLGTVELDVEGFDVDSTVPEQPQGAETFQGAQQRAAAARAAWPDADYAVGVEAGLLQDDSGAWMDTQCCVVLDLLNESTHGWGPGFQYPAWVTARALAGEMISDILGPVSGDPRIGGTTGAVGYLSGGRMDRTQLTQHAVLMAFLPRLRRELYTDDPNATR